MKVRNGVILRKTTQRYTSALTLTLQWSELGLNKGEKRWYFIEYISKIYLGIHIKLQWSEQATHKSRHTHSRDPR
jgi:hypothetical protein